MNKDLFQPDFYDDPPEYWMSKEERIELEEKFMLDHINFELMIASQLDKEEQEIY